MKEKYRVAIYVRCSTSKQEISVDVQLERILKYCNYREFIVVDTIKDEGISGGINRNRPGFIKLLEYVESGTIDAVVLFSLERLSRDMLTMLSLERYLDEYDVQLHTVEGQVDTSTPSGFMNYAMTIFLGEIERRQVKYRTRNAMQYKKRQNEVVGSVGFGFKRQGKKLLPVEEEQKIIEQINQMYEEGMTLAEISRNLDSKGIKTRSGKKWSAQQLKRLIADYEGKWTKRRSKLGEVIKNFIFSVA